MTRPRLSVADLDVAGRRVLVRVDFNVPIKDGHIVDDRRIRGAVPTLQLLRERGARVVVATHLGRPRGQVVDTLRVAPVAARLSELLGVPVSVARDVAGPDALSRSVALADGEVLMLENVRFEAGEETDDPELADRLASLADLFVNDAFGTAHRAHASTHGVALRRPAAAGLLMARELEMLGHVLRDPARPAVAIIGGSKVSTKLDVLRTLLARVDTVWIGGAMACTFYRAQGASTGTSLVEADQIPIAEGLLAEVARTGRELRLPPDALVAASLTDDAGTSVVPWNAIPDDRAVVDVGPATVSAIGASADAAASVVWNGPLGIYEIDAFAQGTRAVARRVADSGATSIIGGGDLAAAVEAAGVAERMTFVSTGGGASLEFLEGRSLPGVAALLERSATAGR